MASSQNSCLANSSQTRFPAESSVDLPVHPQTRCLAESSVIIDGTNPYPAYCLLSAREPVTIESLVKSTHVLDVLAGG